LRGITARTLTQFIARKPQLKTYRFAIERENRYAAHTIPLAAEELSRDLAPFITDWQYTLHENLLARTQYGTVHTSAGELDVQKQRSAIENHPERTVRESGFKKRYNGLASQRDLQAFLLIDLAAGRNHLARLHHYEDAASESYFDRYWTKSEISDLLQRVIKQADTYKRYQGIRANYIKKITGYETVNLWDMSVRPVGSSLPRFTIDQARSTIREALRPLGPMYETELTQLLDPANGRLDIVPGENRKMGGFSAGFIGEPSTFFSSSFAGSYNDVRILAHESTHAVQRQLMNRHGVLPDYFGSPLWESFAMFSELLWADYLYQHEPDPIRKQYFLEQFFEGKGMIMFVAGPEAALEQAVYEGVRLGDIKNADDLDALTRHIYSQFSIWPGKHEELKSEWMDIPLMYEDPFYDLNYVYGGALALKYYQLYRLAPETFVPGYIALLSNGFNAPPDILLKRYLNVDLHDPRLVSDAVSFLDAKLKLLEAGYSKL
jgi:oligoendopeptidase F